MWDIATGRTTIFNPFVSRELLWGVEREPLVHIAAISHITWNPLKKLKEGIKGKGEKDFWMQINAEDIKLPHIIAILQHVCEIDDTAAISSWNMWIPYTIVCEQSDVRTVIQLAEKQWFMTKPLGTITENGKIQIDNIWIGKTSISS
jgi:phosphoribosylaminoimidazole (AIR) synthetase